MRDDVKQIRDVLELVRWEIGGGRYAEKVSEALAALDRISDRQAGVHPVVRCEYLQDDDHGGMPVTCGGAHRTEEHATKVCCAR